MSNILVTGCAGFIGFHLTRRLLQQRELVIGIDNLSPYYEVSLKEARLSLLQSSSNFRFQKGDLANPSAIKELFRANHFDVVINLAAQAGVRHSIKNPEAYIQSNLVGFANVLEACRHGNVKHLVFASSSSVYGANTRMPFSAHHPADHPLSLYAATKKANELMAHAYAHLYGLPCTGLRFFTVYGPWGRPDMALFLFTRAILNDQPIQAFNYGNMARDFTYIDDVVEVMLRLIKKIPQPNPLWDGTQPDSSSSLAPYRIYNVGNNNPVELKTLIEILEAKLGKKAQLEFLALQSGDVPATFADVNDLLRDAAFRPSTPIEKGIEHFVTWYRKYYRV